MGPEIPCGEACPTPHGAGDGGHNEGRSLQWGQGSFHGFRLESFSDPFLHCWTAFFTLSAFSGSTALVGDLGAWVHVGMDPLVATR